MHMQGRLAVPASSAAGDRTPHGITARAAYYTERFLAVRPELVRPEGRFGVALSLTFLAEARRERTCVADLHGGALIWSELAQLELPRDYDPCVVVDAAVSFLAFSGPLGILPEAEARRLRTEARLEGFAYLAFGMGLLSPEDARERMARHAHPSADGD